MSGVAPMWRGTTEFIEESNIAAFMRWLAAERDLDLADYDALWRWSVTDIEAFWQAIWDYFEIHSATPYTSILSSREMPGARWFENARVNYAEHVLRHERHDPERAVLRHLSELRPDFAEMSWRRLGNDVRTLATRLRELGVAPGDRVVAYMPNIPEAVVAMLATTAIGGIWSTAAPEFGTKTVFDRFVQIAPKVMFVADGYRYGGKDFDRRPQIAELAGALETLETIVWLPYLDDAPPPPLRPAVHQWGDLLAGAPVGPEGFEYEYVTSDHPLWILFSSGTTGLPKPIVHGHLGILLEHYKSSAFHLNLKPHGAMYFYSTTGWMMWNTLMWAPLMNAVAVLYDGHPAHPEPDLLWRLASLSGAQSVGASPTLILNMRKLGIVPKDRYDFSQLENIFLVGSPSTPETFAWLYENVKQDLWVTSQSGGTEFCSGLVGGSPTLPVYPGEIQARTLGADIHAFDPAGRSIVGSPGELVITRPMPSMPLLLWGDDDGRRYRDSYFDMYPGAWRHGDSITINERGGCFVHGRSDATLNRYGVRIGSAEIYRTLEDISEVADSLIVCIETAGGGYYMPLFVEMREGFSLDTRVIDLINSRLRSERSPRHVPDEIVVAPAIPYTLTGKKMEVPIRRILMGVAPDEAASRGSMRDPNLLDWFASFAQGLQHRA